jgi:hypothetical protein
MPASENDQRRTVKHTEENVLCTVLALTALKVSRATVDQNGKEECRVEQGDWRSETGAETPGEGLDPVCRVVLQPCVSAIDSKAKYETYGLAKVSPPTASEQLVPIDYQRYTHVPLRLQRTRAWSECT